MDFLLIDPGTQTGPVGGFKINPTDIEISNKDFYGNVVVPFSTTMTPVVLPANGGI